MANTAQNTQVQQGMGLAGLFFRPVRADEIDVRVQSFTAYSATLLLYKDARVDQNILDETVGCYNWQRAHTRENANCTVSIWDNQKGQWISKEDTGVESNTEAQKGLASDSFKRACFNWGIGRELYTTPIVRIPVEFIEVYEKNGRKNTYDKFFVQDIEVSVDEQTRQKRITKLTIGMEHKGQRDWVWSWDGGNQIKTHKPAWCNGGSGNQQPNNNQPTQQSGGWGNSNNANASNGGQQSGWGNNNQSSGNGGWGNNSAPQNAPAQQGNWGNSQGSHGGFDGNAQPSNNGGWGSSGGQSNGQSNAPANNGWGNGNSGGGSGGGWGNNGNNSAQQQPAQKGSFGYGNQSSGGWGGNNNQQPAQQGNGNNGNGGWGNRSWGNNG